VRRQAREGLQQLRQEHDLADVRQRDRERMRARCRIEVVRRDEAALDLRERVARGRQQCQRARRRLHPARRAHEQRIAEVGAQPAERRAHARLAHAEQVAGAAHVARVVERDEIGNQVQIERVHRRANILKMNRTYPLNRVAG
jgi:hypothetical protein